jgi:hypothetical protein
MHRRGKCSLSVSTGRPGVFSMDGHIAPLKEICELARKHDALVFVDDCHATGFVGRSGRGTDEHCGVYGQVDIINSTLGKAMGGATGPYVKWILPLGTLQPWQSCNDFHCCMPTSAGQLTPVMGSANVEHAQAC